MQLSIIQVSTKPCRWYYTCLSVRGSPELKSMRVCLRSAFVLPNRQTDNSAHCIDTRFSRLADQFCSQLFPESLLIVPRT